jgi:hypothetical protein
MSTHDVPGYKAENNDKLATGSWAEHDDGSLIFVESTEANRVVYSMFDMAKLPPVEYRSAMPQVTFEKTFSFGNDLDEVWTWHDKTPFPWDRVIKAGVSDGVKPAFAEHTMTAAERVAESLRLRGGRISGDMGHMADQVRARGVSIWDKISRAVAELGK